MNKFKIFKNNYPKPRQEKKTIKKRLKNLYETKFHPRLAIEDRLRDDLENRIKSI